jgi:hypothetical protein
MVTGSTTEAAAKVTAAKTFTTIIAAARKCGASEDKDNCKSDYGVAQHCDLFA